MTNARPSKRDTDQFDNTQLKMSGHGKTLHRDYSAHFFRWSFARRLITNKDSVLEIGCGEEKPLSKILTGGGLTPHCKSYVGVDINKIKPSASQRLDFYGEFDFTEPRNHNKLIKDHGPFDIVVHFEVIEHMPVKAGQKLLRGAFKALKPGGVMIMSTPVYDGIHHAANHIHEYTVEELEKEVKKAKFEIVERFGTFMNIRHIGKDESARASKDSIAEVYKALKTYFDNDALSNIFGPLYEDSSRNNLWICRKP